MRKTLIATVLLFLAAAAPALAQKAGPNGGFVYEKEGHEAEIVLSPAEIAIYLSHDGKPNKTEGFSLRVVVQQGGKTTPVTLKDDKGNRFVGSLGAPLEKGAIVVVTGKDHHGHALTARHVVR